MMKEGRITQYRVQYRNVYGAWQDYAQPISGPYGKINLPYADSSMAIRAAKWRKERRPNVKLRVVSLEGYGQVMWSSNYPEEGAPVSAPDINPQEETAMGDITKPLNIPRTALIKRLQEVRDEAEKKRQDAAEAAAARRQSLLDAVEKLTNDQIANVLNHFVNGSQEGLEKTVNEWVEEKKFVSLDSEPSGVETVLERTIRVLGLASDSTVEVRPTDSIYAYL